ncbi:MAG: carboxypeptidase regulatory-like domain-containing protein, partial [Gemmatimonadetes bacterium]|nr:carboxypeptidase regulatory-like domain-containing protein [Gemmatimonadota bacterium]
MSALWACLPSEALGQVVSGEVVDRSTGGPLAGVWVELLGPDSSRQAAGLTNTDGRFSLRLATGDTYRLRAEHIGYSAFEDDVLITDAAVRRRIVLQRRVLNIEAIQVESARRCVIARDLAVETLALWRGAQQAFHAASWDPAARARVFRSVIYERQLEPRTRLVLRERADSTTSRGAAFVGAPHELITRYGYVRAAGSAYEFYAPDPILLTSDAFAEDYCLRLRRDGPDDERLGLAFEPVTPRAGGDIRGTVWFDAGTLMLRSVEFTYTWIPWDVDADAAGGEMEFAPLADGGWIVHRWSIRTPSVETSAYGRGHRLVGLDESAGTVLRVLGPGQTLLASFAGARLEGAVYDSARGGYRDGIRLLLEPEGRVATTNHAGEFLMEDLPAGEYVVRVDDDALPLAVASHVSLSSGRTTRTVLRLPGMDTRLRSRCARGVVGIVTDASGTPVIGLPVSTVGGTSLIMTDASGAYALCDLPVDTSVSIRVGQPANPITTVMVATTDSVERRDIQMSQDQTGTARIVGIVRDIDNDEGIVAAAVRVGGNDRTFLTDAAGRFVIPAVPAGSHAISVEALGYGDVSETVAIGPGEQIRLEVTLGRDAIRLAALEVVARSARPGPLADFAERKELGEKLGIGVFLERDELRQRGASVLDVVRGMPRVRLVQGGIGSYRIMFGRGITACEPHIYVDGILLTRPGFMDGRLEELIPYGPYEAVEIYRTPSELPAEFGGSDG